MIKYIFLILFTISTLFTKGQTTCAQLRDKTAAITAATNLYEKNASPSAGVAKILQAPLTRKVLPLKYKVTGMKKQCIIFGLIFLFTNTVNAQSVKKAEKDTVKSSNSKDRLRNAGPRDGWPDGSKPDSAKKIKAAAAPARKKGSGN